MNLESSTNVIFAERRISPPNGTTVVDKNSNRAVRIQGRARATGPVALLHAANPPRSRRAGTKRLDHPDLTKLLEGLDSGGHAFGDRQPEHLGTVRPVPSRKVVTRLDGRQRQEDDDTLHLHDENPPFGTTRITRTLHCSGKLRGQAARAPFGLGSGSRPLEGPPRVAPVRKLPQRERRIGALPESANPWPQSTTRTVWKRRWTRIERTRSTTSTVRSGHANDLRTRRLDAGTRTARTHRDWSEAQHPIGEPKTCRITPPFHHHYTRSVHHRERVQKSDIQRGERPRSRRRSPMIFPCGKA